jgi:hypothetical protein
MLNFVDDRLNTAIEMIDDRYPRLTPITHRGYAAWCACLCARHWLIDTLVCGWVYATCPPIIYQALLVVRSRLFLWYWRAYLYAHYNAPALWPVAVAAVAWPFVMYICWHLATLR